MTEPIKNEALDLFFSWMEKSARTVHKIRSMTIAENINNAAHLSICKLIASSATRFCLQLPFIDNNPNENVDIEIQFPNVNNNSKVVLCKFEVLAQCLEFLRILNESINSWIKKTNDFILELDHSLVKCTNNEEYEALFDKSDQVERIARNNHARNLSLLTHQKSLLCSTQSYLLKNLSVDILNQLRNSSLDGSLDILRSSIETKFSKCEIDSTNCSKTADVSLMKMNRQFSKRYDGMSSELYLAVSHNHEVMERTVFETVDSKHKLRTSVIMNLPTKTAKKGKFKEPRAETQSYVDVERNIPSLLERQLACEALLNFFGKKKTFEAYQTQVFKFFNLPSGKVILMESSSLQTVDNCQGSVTQSVQRQCVNNGILFTAEQDQKWLWDVIDSLMSRINVMVMYEVASVDEKSLLHKFREYYHSTYFQLKSFGSNCNLNALHSTMRQRLRSELHMISVMLFKGLSIDNPIDVISYKPFESLPTFKKSNDEDDNTITRDICRQMLIEGFGQTRKNADLKMLAYMMMRIKHLKSVSGQLSFNVGLMICLIMNSLTTFSDCSVMTYYYMEFYWKHLLDLPFIDRSVSECGSTTGELTLEEQKCCLNFFAALTTFVPLPVNNCFDQYSKLDISDSQRMTMFLSVQKQELASLSMLLNATKKSYKLSEDFLLCSIASHCTVWKYLQAAHTNIFEFHNERFLKIRVWIALVPTVWMDLTVKILLSALRKPLFAGRNQALMLASKLVHILTELHSQCNITLDTIRRNTSQWNSEIKIAIGDNKRRILWGLGEIKTKLELFIENAISDVVIQEDVTLYGCISSANLKLKQNL